jgi:aryl sulfotransferase
MVDQAAEIAVPQLVRAPLIEVRSRVFDSARWSGYQPRADDIVIATYSKCGTTWMQRIVAMLVMQSAEPAPIWDLSPWPDMRIFGPVEAVMAAAEAMTHRRFFKSHLPYDALPIYGGVKFIHVARDGRDAAMSLHNHLANFTPAGLCMLDDVSLVDPKFGTPYPRAPADAAQFFRQWVSDGGSQGDLNSSFFHVEQSFWVARRDPNVLLVHYNDLKQDRAGEMRRIAAFLGIDVADDLWPSLIEAAGFDAMKREAAALIPMAAHLWDEGPDRFMHKGTNGRWRDVVADGDLAIYEAKIRTEFTPGLANWLENGRLVAGDPERAIA